MSTWHNVSIIRRITWFTGVVAALLCALLAATVMIAIHRYATGSAIEEVTAACGRVATQVEHDRVVPPLVGHRDRNMQVVDPRGVVVVSTPQLRGKPVMAGFAPDGRKIMSSVVCGGVFPSGGCHIVVAQSAYRAGQDWIVYGSTPTVPWYVDPWLAATVLGAAGLLAAAVTFLGYRIVTVSLRPVDAIRAELDRINETCPERRVPFPPGRDEVHDLAGSINQTLVRLHAAMQQQRTFTSDASHELRTPLAAIRAEVEDALYAPEESSVPTLGSTVLRSVDRLEAIVGTLLAMARLQAERPVEREPIDLAELVTTECQRRPKTDKRLEYSLDPGVTVIGDRVQLSRLLTNLIDNAERHAATTIALRVRHSPAPKRDAQRFPTGVATLEVNDDGPGIAPDKRELAFQRFARLDTARDREAGGTGLGLPMARQIAEAHGGTLEIGDSPQGTRFVLRLPAAP
ncbi:HAMP domain-containing histidine kinase [Nonomuraea sp. K274]|uniref:histidine kinase n=1 Tax=Nonomuraea cypriaca TaxID=1187855 RepID=A0A931AJZ1_9ACTN|nr:HAMP domain-containing sensor histidine kinase [Nonomuraea cypriaca]MBF8193125.1 HAMP domain-containing histidine kinase [Nonomuraea cypriaca]